MRFTVRVCVMVGENPVLPEETTQAQGGTACPIGMDSRRILTIPLFPKKAASISPKSGTMPEIVVAVRMLLDGTR